MIAQVNQVGVSQGDVTPQRCCNLVQSKREGERQSQPGHFVNNHQQRRFGRVCREGWVSLGYGSSQESVELSEIPLAVYSTVVWCFLQVQLLYSFASVRMKGKESNISALDIFLRERKHRSECFSLLVCLIRQD